jgi:hypothetical protein
LFLQHARRVFLVAFSFFSQYVRLSCRLHRACRLLHQFVSPSFSFSPSRSMCVCLVACTALAACCINLYPPLWSVCPSVSTDVISYCSVKRDLTVSKETYYSVKRDLPLCVRMWDMRLTACRLLCSSTSRRVRRRRRWPQQSPESSPKHLHGAGRVRFGFLGISPLWPNTSIRANQGQPVSLSVSK